MSHYRLSLGATEDLFDMFVQGLGQFGHRQAETYQHEIKATFARLAEFPEIGRSRPDVSSTARTWPFRAHIIIYRCDADGGIRILRVRSAREDWIDSPVGDPE